MTEEIIIDVNGCPHKSDDDCMEVPICNEYGDLMGYQSCEAQTLCPYRSQKKIKRLEQENNSLQAQLNNITVQSNNDITALEQENKSLDEEKNCLHKIIDRLLENAGYSKDIASAEDFEDVYEDMQIKRNELIELEQENKELKTKLDVFAFTISQYESALEEIKDNFMRFRSCMIPFHVGDKDNLPHKMADAIQNCCESIINKINEVLNDK